MFDFLSRWVSDVVRLTLSLALAIMAMQLPALTHDYTAALLQVTNSSRHDIDQREASARAYYHLASDDDQALIKALRDKEPSNAAALDRSLQQLGILRAAYDRIVATHPLLRPPVALFDAARNDRGSKWDILRTALATHQVQIALTEAAAIYGLAGLMLGALIAHLLASFGAWTIGVRRRPGYV